MIFIILFNFLFFLLILNFILFFIKANTYCFFIYQFNFINFISVFLFLSLFYSLITKNPINILLLVLFSFVLIAFCLFNIFIQLPTIMFVIIYMGALMMLFLFVVMLFNLQKIQEKNFFLKKSRFLLIVFIVFCYNISENLYEINFSNSNSFITFFNEMDFLTIFFFNKFVINGNFVFYPLFTKNFNIFFIFLTFILFCTLIIAITIIFLTKNNNKHLA